MLQHHTQGAAAPGSVTPAESDEAPGLAGTEGFKEQGAEDGRILEQADADRKRIATLQARAALLGLALHTLHGGACVLVGEAGKPARAPSLQAAEALVWGIEQVRAEVAALAGSLVHSREVRA
jgi:hypothetical protein